MLNTFHISFFIHSIVTGHMSHVEEKRNACEVLATKPEGKDTT
jgi:hypothetical protein